MKQIFYIATVITVLSSCKDKIYNKYKVNAPVYMDKDEFRNSIEFQAPKSIAVKGNIYLKDDYLYVIEPDQGIHIIDNSNPASPKNTGFLKILGCTGMAIKGTNLVANSFIDLVVIDIQDPLAPKEIKRIPDLFPDAIPLSDQKHPTEGIDSNQGVVVGWKVEDRVEEVENQPYYGNSGGVIDDQTWVSPITSAGSGSNSGALGISASITKFALINDYLYIMDENKLLSINMQDVHSPLVSEPVLIWNTVETLFASGDNLFMGTTTGMLIYSVANPSSPLYMATMNHARACDPVVVRDQYAYVTVRSGSRCGGNVNQLDVIDISDLSNPVLKSSFQMTNPHGLGIDGNSLFVCDGADGLKVYDASNPPEAGNHLLSWNKSFQATDLIPHNQLAIVIGDDGIYQYNYADLNDIYLVSKIPFF